MPSFTRPPHISDKMYDNLQNDDVCPPSLLDDLVHALTGCANEVDAINAHGNWKNSIDQDMLPMLTALSSTNCGRLAFWRALYNHIEISIEDKFGLGIVTSTDISEAIAKLTGQPSSFTNEEADSFYRDYILELPISSRTVWLFLVDDRVDVSKDLGEGSCLPWRLGLDRVDHGSRYIGMVVDAAAVAKPRTPCNADVDYQYHDLWKAGGETLKLAATPTTCDPRGCHEIVAPPPKFSSLSMQLHHVTAL